MVTYPLSRMPHACANRVFPGSLCLLFLAGCMANTDTPDVKFERATMLADRGMYEEAVPLYGEALAAWPDDPDVYFSRGLCYERLDLNDRALEDYTACLKFDPEHTDARNNRGVILARLERFEESAAEFTQLIRLQPDNILALRNRGLCYHDLHNFDLALADYDLAVEKAPDDVNNWFQRGNVYLEQDRYAEAIRDFSQAIAVDPEFSRAWMNRGVAQYELNNRAEALSDLKQAQRLDSNIVLPAIDWVGDDSFAEAAPAIALAPVTVAAAKPVLDRAATASHNDTWAETIAFATAHLEQLGYSDVVVDDSYSDQQCGQLQARRGNDSVTIYLGMKTDEPFITLPAVDTDSHSLLILSRSNEASARSAEGSASGLAVVLLVEDWKPDHAAVEPVIVKVPLDDRDTRLSRNPK